MSIISKVESHRGPNASQTFLLLKSRHMQIQRNMCTVACNNIQIIYMLGWPEPYIYTVYARIFGDFPAKNIVNTPYMTVYLVISLPKIPYIHRI